MSKTQKQGRFRRLAAVGVLLTGAAILSGCNGHTLDPFGQSNETTSAVPAKAQPRVKERAPRSNSEAFEAAFEPNGEFFRTADQIRAEPSARCRRILAQAGIATTSLRSPTVSANVNDDADVDLGMSYDLMDWKRANLTEELAFARCERQEIATKLIQLTTTSSQSLSRSGYLARARVLRANRGKLRNIRGQITRSLGTGSMTVGAATTLRQYISQIEALEAQALGEAGRREVVDALYQTDFRALDHRLTRIETTIHDIENRRRSVDAVKVRASANYGTDFGDSFGTSNNRSGDSDVSAKLEVSLRLGALYGRRHELEEIARESAQSQHSENGSGILWRTGIVRQSIDNVLRSLIRQRSDISNAIAEARRNARIPTEQAFAEDLLGARLRAQVDMISLRSRFAAIDATIRDTRVVQAKLQFKK